MKLLLVALCVPLLALAAGAADVSGPRVPFGSHLGSYAPGTLRPSFQQRDLDRLVAGYYAKWKAAFFVRIVGTGWKAIRSPDADHPFVAEAQGYGLEVFALMAGADPEAKDCFDALLAYVLDHPSQITPALMAAEQNSAGVSVNGGDSATDGDLAIAYALLMADHQWGSTRDHPYRDLAIVRIKAIKRYNIDPVTRLPLLGDWSSPDEPNYHSTRPSDFMLDHFRAFRAATSDRFWDSVIVAMQKLVTHLQREHASGTGLLPDFVVATDTRDPRPAPAHFLEGKDDGNFSYNAARVPWRLGADAALHGDPTSREQAQKISAWIRGDASGDPANISAGYTLSGQSLGDGGDMVFIATLAPAAMHSPADQPWLDALCSRMAAEAARPGVGDYYASSLLLQSLILISGNAWSPSG